MNIILSVLNRFQNFFAGRFLGKLAVKWISKIPPHLTCVATLPCETLMSSNQAINDKLQSIVATYLRCDGVVNNQIKKGLLLSLWVKKCLNRWIFGKVTGKNVIVLCTCTLGQHTAKRRRKCTKQSHSCLLLYQIFTDLRNYFTHRLSNKPFLIWLLTTHHTLNM